MKPPKKISKRITYSYFDNEKGFLQSYIDVDLEIDDTNEYTELSQEELQKYVARKWGNIGYMNGEIDTVEQVYID